MRNLMYLMLVFISVSFIAIGCSKDSSEKSVDKKPEEKNQVQANESKYADELRVAINAQPTSLDPHITTASITSVISRNVFETLVAMNADYEPVPMLAESIEESDDMLTYTFKLRQGVKFHNGEEMTSEDVVASMEHWYDSSAIAQNALGEGAKFSADGDYTVILELKEVSSGLLNTLATPKQLAAIYPKKVIDSIDDSGNITEFIGTGPYKFEEWVQDQYIHFSRFEDYASREEPTSGMSGSKKPQVNNLYFDIVTDSSTRQAGIVTDMYHIAIDISPEHYEQTINDDNLEVLLDSPGYIIMNFNKKEGPLTDVYLRKAIATALKVDDIMLGALGNPELYDVYSGFMKQSQQMYTDVGSEYYNQANIEEAKKLLEQSDYNGEELQLLASRDYDRYYQSATIIQEQLKEVGINVELAIYDWPTFLDLENDPTAWDMEVTGYTTWITPAENIIFNKTSPGWTNDPSLDVIIENIKGATTDEEQQKYYDELHEFLLVDYVPGIKLGNYKSIAAMSKKVENVDVFEGLILWNAGLKE